jgi:hypothetical protein
MEEELLKSMQALIEQLGEFSKVVTNIIPVILQVAQNSQTHSQVHS